MRGALFLPTVAAALIAATTSSKIGLPVVSMAAFGIGILFWVVILPLLLARLLFVPALPDPLQPTLAILLAPPAVAGIAWFQMTGSSVTAYSSALLGITLLMLLMQAFMLPTYARVQFSLGFWSFTFPVAAAGSYLIEWIALASVPGWQVGVLVILAGVTALVGYVATRSLGLAWFAVGGGRAAEDQLTKADAAQSVGGPHGENL